jgi:hypothetical protein
MRVEHWTNAAEQGAVAAKNLLAQSAGEPTTPYESVPFFWSDQFDSRIQFVGRPHGDDEVHDVAVTVNDMEIVPDPEGETERVLHGEAVVENVTVPHGLADIDSDVVGETVMLADPHIEPDTDGEDDAVAFGDTLAGAGDSDGDGRVDLLIGDPRGEDVASDGGGAWLFRNRRF